VVEDIEYYSKRLGFDLVAHCIMPDHLHVIVWWDTEMHPALTISKIVHAFKSHSARRIIDYQIGRRGPLTSPWISSGQGTRATQGRGYLRQRMSDQVHHIWQPSFYGFNIYSAGKL
jgi:REP element-mobilizing transposase RayT